MQESIKQLEELKEVFEAGTFAEAYCVNQKCAKTDCCVCVLRKAIEIVKKGLQ
jgi:hypothetical protein